MVAFDGIEYLNFTTLSNRRLTRGTLMKSNCACLAIAASIIVVCDVIAAQPTTWDSAIAASNPLNWYRLDETTGSAAVDYGTQGLTGTYGSGIHAPARGAAGLVGGAAEFDGDRKNIFLGGSSRDGDWTAEFILKKTGTKSSAELLRGAPLEYPSSHLKLEQYPNTGQVGFTESFIVDRVFSPAVVAPLHQFVHLVYVRDNGGMKAYLNGSLAGTSGSSVSLYRYQFGDTESESPIAVVDEIVVYGRALPAAEIAGHFRAIPEPGSLVQALFGLSLFAGARRNCLTRRVGRVE
jgi:concanavalin A-like lectin/glucanase superfamily protein